MTAKSKQRQEQIPFGNDSKKSNSKGKLNSRYKCGG